MVASKATSVVFSGGAFSVTVTLETSELQVWGGVGVDVNMGVATESNVMVGSETDTGAGMETGVNADVGTVWWIQVVMSV